RQRATFSPGAEKERLTCPGLRQPTVLRSPRRSRFHPSPKLPGRAVLNELSRTCEPLHTRRDAGGGAAAAGAFVDRLWQSLAMAIRLSPALGAGRLLGHRCRLPRSARWTATLRTDSRPAAAFPRGASR